MVGHVPEGVEGGAVAADEDEAGDLVLRVEAPPILEAEVNGYLVAVEDQSSFVSEDVGRGLEFLQDVVGRLSPYEVALEVEGVEPDAYLAEARLEALEAVADDLPHVLDRLGLVVLVGGVQPDDLGLGVLYLGELIDYCVVDFRVSVAELL